MINHWSSESAYYVCSQPITDQNPNKTYFNSCKLLSEVPCKQQRQGKHVKARDNGQHLRLGLNSSFRWREDSERDSEPELHRHRLRSPLRHLGTHLSNGSDKPPRVPERMKGTLTVRLEPVRSRRLCRASSRELGWMSQVLWGGGREGPISYFQWCPPPCLPLLFVVTVTILRRGIRYLWRHSIGSATPAFRRQEGPQGQGQYLFPSCARCPDRATHSGPRQAGVKSTWDEDAETPQPGRSQPLLCIRGNCEYLKD